MTILAARRSLALAAVAAALAAACSRRSAWSPLVAMVPTS